MKTSTENYDIKQILKNKIIIFILYLSTTYMVYTMLQVCKLCEESPFVGSILVFKMTLYKGKGNQKGKQDKGFDFNLKEKIRSIFC